MDYEGEAVEFQERRDFRQHVAWGAAHKGPGIRFVCTSDAVDDPDNKGFWAPLNLFNRRRHETYKDNRHQKKPSSSVPQSCQDLTSFAMICRLPVITSYLAAHECVAAVVQNTTYKIQNGYESRISPTGWLLNTLATEH